MTGGATAASDHHTGVLYRQTFQIALHGMTSLKMYQVKVTADKIEYGAGRFADNELCLPRIFNTHTFSNNIFFRKYTVKQCHFHPVYRIPQNDYKGIRLRFLCKGTGKAVQAIFSGTDLVRNVHKIARNGLVRIFHPESHIAVISASPVRIFLGKHVERIGTGFSFFCRISGKASVHISQQIIHILPNLCPVIQMQQMTVLINFHLVGSIFCFDSKDFCAGFKKNCHI